jgi:hypothetical protein
MFFSSYLFKVLFDLVTQTNLLSDKFQQSKKNKKYKEMINNDFNQDLDITKYSDRDSAPLNEDEDGLDNELQKKIQ